MEFIRPNLILQPTDEIKTHQEFKDKAMKCKVIALSQLNYHPTNTNPTDLQPKIRRKIISIMEDYIIKSNAEVDIEFNEIVNNEILGNKSKYEEYRVSNPVLPPTYNLNT
jgi:hypothetical protein